MAAQDIRDKVFFITGAASGIGKAVAEGVLAKSGKIFCIDVQETACKQVENELATKYGAANVHFAVADVSDRSCFQEAFNQAVATFGSVDVLLNNAAIVCETRPEDVVSVNLLGTIYGTEIATAHMRKDQGGKGGRIINVSSIAGLEFLTHTPIYGATKHAVRAYTQSLALSPKAEERGLEYATLIPEIVKTNMVANLKPGDILFLDEMLGTFGDKFTPVEELADAFIYLVCLECMNGAALFVRPGKRTFMKVVAQEMGNTYPLE